MKDLFIDNNIAKNFANPMDQNYKILIQWLLDDYSNRKNDAAYLVVSNKLLGEYFRSSRNCSKSTSIPVIIDRLLRENRILKISNKEMKEFYASKIKKRVANKFNCNSEDRDLIPVVLLSNRKFALTLDQNFANERIGKTTALAES